MARRLTNAQAGGILLIGAIVGIVSLIVAIGQFLLGTFGIKNILIISALLIILVIALKIISNKKKKNFAKAKLEEWMSLNRGTLPKIKAVGINVDKLEKICFSEPFFMAEGNLKAEHQGTLILTDERIIFNSISALVEIKARDVISAQATNTCFVIGKKGKKRQYYFYTPNKVNLAKLIAFFSILSEGNIKRAYPDLFKILIK